MARAHAGLDSLTKYLKTDFPWKKDFYCEPLDLTFTHAQIEEAIRKVKVTDPKLHRIASWRWMSYRSRNEIANALYMDSSTLKRYWDKFGNLVMNYLVHGELIDEMHAIDLIQMD